MNLYHPFAAEILALIFNQVPRPTAAPGGGVHPRLRPRRVSSSRHSFTGVVTQQFNSISRLKCRRETPIQSRWITVSGDRKLPEGKTDGRLFQRPVPRQGCRVNRKTPQGVTHGRSQYGH